MLGEGIVSLGVCASETHARRNSNASPKIVSDTPSRSPTCSDGGAYSIVPCALRNWTWSVSSTTLEIPSSE